MDIKQLRYFIAVVDAGSITRAARRCYVVQSAISQQIAALESSLGVALLVRSRKGVSPTPAGEILYLQSQQILRHVAQASRMVSGATCEPAGLVSVGLPTSTAASLAGPLIDDCLRRYPKIHLKIYEGLSQNIKEKLTRAGLDLAVLFSTQSRRGLNVIPLMTEELFLVKQACSEENPDHYTIGRYAWDDVDSLPWVLPEAGNGLRDHIDQLFASIGISISPCAEVSSLRTILDVVADGIGVSILPWGAFAQEYAQNKIAAHRLKDVSVIRTLLLCTPGDIHLTNAAHAVFKLIRELSVQLVIGRRWEKVRLYNSKNSLYIHQ